MPLRVDTKTKRASKSIRRQKDTTMELLRTGIICYKITFFIADFIAFFSQEVLKNRKKLTSELTETQQLQNIFSQYKTDRISSSGKLSKRPKT